MKQKIIAFCAFIATIILYTTPALAQVQEIYNSNQIYMQLQKLQVLGSVLYIAAHPDDENNGLLPYLAKEKNYRTAYLSLTRGDGGQNLIGSEQGVELGLIRTQELIAARRIDGCEQYFTRAYEFGFSKSAAEALRIWNKEKILSDVVWVIRNYQPDIIITRFPGDERAGHGHHAASSLLANEAFKAAADSTRFPEQLALGVKPWQAKRIFWNTYNFGSINTTADNQLQLNVGVYNPLLGKSYGEIGAEARTMHKSQGEGRPLRRGDLIEYFALTGGEPAKKDLMENVVIDWSRLKGGDAIQPLVNNLVQQFSFTQPEKSVEGLLALYKIVKQLPDDGNWKKEKLQAIEQLIVQCSGIYAEAFTNQETVVQGGVVPVTCYITKRNALPIQLLGISVDSKDTIFQKKLLPNEQWQTNKMIQVAKNQPISQPYWLIAPQEEGAFTVKDQALIGKAENDPVFQVKFTVQIGDEILPIHRPVQYKLVDPVRGELYQPLVILPAKEGRFEKDNYVSANGQKITVGASIKQNAKDSSFLSLLLTPTGWQNKTATVDLLPGKESRIETSLQPNQKDANQVQPLYLHSNTDTLVYTKSIKYDHIPNITYFPTAKTHLVQAPLKKNGKKIGYIAGAGDKVPEALEQMGYEVVSLKEADLSLQNLRQFQAIVTGVRAYNLHEWLNNKHAVLMEYINQGGNLIVQYLRSNTIGSKSVQVGPYPFTVNSSLRVTQEDAPVNFLLPNHPTLHYPNEITVDDFKGWVQERSTYQAEKIDNHYETPIGMNDVGEKPSNGSLLIAPYGKGNFVYSSLVFFRQLPAGVPGAYRLMANLIALQTH